MRTSSSRTSYAVPSRIRQPHRPVRRFPRPLRTRCRFPCTLTHLKHTPFLHYPDGHIRIGCRQDGTLYTKVACVLRPEFEAAIGGEYLTLTSDEDHLTAPMLAFFSDSHLMLPLLIPLPSPDMYVDSTVSFPHISRKTMSNVKFRCYSWLPTMVLMLEFKFPIPKPSNPHCSQRTVAVYSRGKFVNDPGMRHDTYVEVWTAPSNIGEGSETEDWKVHQRCLAVGTQMALVVPGDLNRKKGKQAQNKAMTRL